MKQSQLPASHSPYYKNVSRVPLASQVSLRVRQRMFALFMQLMQPSEHMQILDLGVTSDTTNAESNFLEQLYPYREKIVCAGTEDAGHLEQLYPGVKFCRIGAKNTLPFADRQFDIVFSNAVVEHTGGSQSQSHFIQETLRVAKAFFITTPNRWFPIEMHTAMPFLHYLPQPLYRSLLTRMGLPFWASEDHLNLLDARGFAQLFPHNTVLHQTTVQCFGFPSNLIAYGNTSA
jgi:hypothetical protein